MKKDGRSEIDVLGYKICFDGLNFILSSPKGVTICYPLDMEAALKKICSLESLKGAQGDILLYLDRLQDIQNSISLDNIEAMKKLERRKKNEKYIR